MVIRGSAATNTPSLSLRFTTSETRTTAAAVKVYLVVTQVMVTSS
jgi:hypothetical protein